MVKIQAYDGERCSWVDVEGEVLPHDEALGRMLLMRGHSGLAFRAVELSVSSTIVTNEYASAAARGLMP